MYKTPLEVTRRTGQRRSRSLPPQRHQGKSGRFGHGSCWRRKVREARRRGWPTKCNRQGGHIQAGTSRHIHMSNGQTQGFAQTRDKSTYCKREDEIGCHSSWSTCEKGLRSLVPTARTGGNMEVRNIEYNTTSEDENQESGREWGEQHDQ